MALPPRRRRKLTAPHTPHRFSVRGIFERLSRLLISGLYLIDAQCSLTEDSASLPYDYYSLPSAKGRMLFEGRKHLRKDERFLVQVSSVHDPLLTALASVENQSPSGVRLATERSWELGLHVDVKSVAGDLNARGRVVYCKSLGPKKFIVGLNILSRDSDQPKPPTPNP